MAYQVQISDIICNVGGKNKFFDMRNALVTECYAKNKIAGDAYIPGYF